ncbi:MAG: hypothetical protein J5I41_08275 [Saprospiraceae bacterium]|nr:hypothetical protein [Saprospiraceae bacterium]
MKHAWIIFALWMGGSQGVEAHGPEVACRQYIVPGDYATEKARLAADLTAGVWQMQTGRLGDARGSIFFHEFGMADQIITATDGKMDYKRLHWTIEMYNGAPFLVISHIQLDGQVNLYRMTPNCEGMDLTDAASLERIRLIYAGPRTAEVEKMAHYLTGSWTTDAYPFDITDQLDQPGTFEPINGAFLQLAFKGNGTFVREWGNVGVTYREEGYWDITADGEYLLLHIFKSGTDEVVRSEVARINQMGDGICQVRQALEFGASDDNYRTKVKDFTFRRWTTKV